MTQKQLFFNSSGCSILTDEEIRHYHSLYNPDPVVQRLCQFDYNAVEAYEEEINDLKDEVSDLDYENDNLRDRVRELERQNAVLSEKIKIWKALESE